MFNNNDLKSYNIKKLLDNNKYVIPIYQRNFAWRAKEISQFITDISDYANENKDKKACYYIGTLIVDRKDNGSLEIIDGQQRLTTLYILLSFIKNDYSTRENYKEYLSGIGKLKLNLTFESRPKYINTLNSLYDNGIDNIDEDMDYSIIKGYNICKSKLTEVLNEKFKGEETQFFKYLFEKVMILQVPVLEDTDLNHYFEIMNTRGEQLEMHEILKARCLDKLCNDDREIFNIIWEACSDMGRYIQFGFDMELRQKIFGENWYSLIGREDFREKIYKNNDNKENNNNISDNDKNNELKISYTSIEKILSDKKTDSETSKDGENIKDGDSEASEERFNSVINFPNFLLHVLKIQEPNKDISLDDKKLLKTFFPFLHNDFVKTFGYNLLKIRFLFDKYIIKSEFKANKNAREWSLKYLNKDSDYNNTFSNDKILMLLSMFHVSYQGQTYKNWLYEALSYLYMETDITPENYENTLKKLARTRFLDYLHLPNKENTTEEELKEALNNTLDKDTSVPYFIFNYLDYLLWEDNRFDDYLGDDKKFIDEAKIKQKIKDFKFTIRNSVEHYYPKNPKYPTYTEPKNKNSFGNLCLINNWENSRLNNDSPKEKRKDLIQKDYIISIKQAIMMSYNGWKETEIEKHGEKMKELLKTQIIKN